jgi:small conductance mechanosensitive channel
VFAKPPICNTEENRMDLTSASDPILAVQTGFGAVWALVIAYSLSVVGAVVLIIVGYLAAGLLERGIHSALGQIRGFDDTLRSFFSKTARYAVLILVLVMVLGQFGVQTASIIAAIGAIGLAIGLALQGTVQNIAAGVMLLVLRPFRIGEEVEVGSVAGTIEDIGLFATSLKAGDGTFILAPNTTLWNQPVKNFTRNGTRRNEIVVKIAADMVVERARNVLLEIVRQDPRAKPTPAPTALVSEIGGSAVALTLRYWTAVPDFGATRFDLLGRVKGELDRLDMQVV